MVFKNIELKSRYIPVGQTTSKWINKDFSFYYPYILVNLLQFSGSRKDAGIPDDVFLLTDSGGFQVISGRTDLDWKGSIDKQLEIGASRLFAFDKPPFEKKSEESNAVFNKMEMEATKKIIDSNIDVALKQSEYLSKTRPERIKDFFYILQAYNKELLDYNISALHKRIGMENFKKYFGGICYSMKADDIYLLTTALIHANHNFIKKDIPVHALGLGSHLRIVLLVRNKITTFDSTTAIVGQMHWSFFNNINVVGKQRIVKLLSSTYWPFSNSICDCPVCTSYDLKDTITKVSASDTGKLLSAHNLYQLYKLNVFLDGIDTKEYTRVVNEFIELDEDMRNCLDYCDYADKVGIDVAYDKYRHFIGKDKTQQRGLF